MGCFKRVHAAYPVTESSFNAEGSLDRRRSRRFDLHIPAVCRPKSSEAIHEFGGFTRDVSSGGAFIHSLSLPAEGLEVDVEIVLPPLEADSHDLKLRCEGVVVRVVRTETTSGFAVSNREKGYVLGPP